MEDKIQDESEKKSQTELLNELFENIDKQLELNTKLKEILKPFMKGSSRRKKDSQIEPEADIIRDCYIEVESLQAEGRAIFHQLFGTEYEY